MSRPTETEMILAALRRRFKPPEWAFFAEVANGTGQLQDRFADAVAMNLYPSRGLEVNGFEIKASRGDFLAELKRPEKAEPVQCYCHRWWVVTAKGVVHDVGEIPVTWGWIERRGSRLYTKRKAPKLEAKLDHGFVAAVLRRASAGMVPEASIRAMVSEAEDRAFKRGEDAARRQDSMQMEAEDRARQAIAKFEEASGVRVDPWRAGNIGEAVALVLKIQQHGKGWNLKHASNAAASILESVDKLQRMFS